MTSTELITQAMHRLGYLEAAETPTSEDVAACLDAANDFIDACGLDHLLLHHTTRNTHNLTANTASYTIGPSGAWDRARPIAIEHVGLVLDRTATTPFERSLGHPLTFQDYSRISQKSATAEWPDRVFWDGGIASGRGTLYLHPVPTAANAQIVLYLLERLSELAADNTEYTFAPGYRRFLTYSLALEFAPILGAVPTEDVRRIAAEARTAIQLTNFRPQDLTIPAGTPGMTRGRFNIETGSYD